MFKPKTDTNAANITRLPWRLNECSIDNWWLVFDIILNQRIAKFSRYSQVFSVIFLIMWWNIQWLLGQLETITIWNYQIVLIIFQIQPDNEIQYLTYLYPRRNFHESFTGKEDNLMTELLHELVEMTRSSNELESHEAARCLGNIGLLDLGVVALKGRPTDTALSRAVDYFMNDAVARCHCRIFHSLNNFLTDTKYVRVVWMFTYFIPLEG